MSGKIMCLFAVAIAAMLVLAVATEANAQCAACSAPPQVCAPAAPAYAACAPTVCGPAAVAVRVERTRVVWGASLRARRLCVRACRR